MSDTTKDKRGANNSCIYGNVVGHATPQPDWNQTDSSKADYIRNKPNISGGGGSVGILVVTTRDDAVIINSSTNVSVAGDAIIIGGA